MLRRYKKSLKDLQLNIGQFTSIINSIILLDKFVKRQTHEDIFFSFKKKLRNNKLLSILYKVNFKSNNFIIKKYLFKWKSQSKIYNNNNNKENYNIKYDTNSNNHKYEKIFICFKIIELFIIKKLKYDFINKLKNIGYNRDIQVKNEEIIKLKNKNISLNYRIKDFEVNNNIEIKTIKELKEKIKYLEKITKKDYLIDLMDKIIKKDEEIKELKSKIPFELSGDEKLMSIIFISSKQDIMQSIICKNTDKFNKLINILYDKHPNYKNSENYFICIGKKVNEYETLENNGIEDNGVIVINKVYI